MPEEGAYGTLYGHVARANPQWKLPPKGDAMALFMGPDAYVTPSWYPSKQEHGRSCRPGTTSPSMPMARSSSSTTPDRLLEVVTRLTDLHERPRAEPWAVTDAPADFIRAQLRGIVGLRLPITRIEGKRKMSQNRNAADRAGVAAGLAASEHAADLAAAALIPG